MRAGLTNHDMAPGIAPEFENLVESMPDSRIIAFTAHATKLYTDIEYKPTDILLFGPEPVNIPDPMDIAAGPHVAEQVRLPMRPSLRSLNLSQLRLHRHLRSLATVELCRPAAEVKTVSGVVDETRAGINRHVNDPEVSRRSSSAT